MKKRKLSAIKLFFLFATLGACPFLYPAMQFQQQPLVRGYDRSFDVRLAAQKATHLPANAGVLNDKLDTQKPSTQVFVPIAPTLGSEVQPDTIE